MEFQVSDKEEIGLNMGFIRTRELTSVVHLFRSLLKISQDALVHVNLVRTW